MTEAEDRELIMLLIGLQEAGARLHTHAGFRIEAPPGVMTRERRIDLGRFGAAAAGVAKRLVEAQDKLQRSMYALTDDLFLDWQISNDEIQKLEAEFSQAFVDYVGISAGIGEYSAIAAAFERLVDMRRQYGREACKKLLIEKLAASGNCI